MLRYVIIAVVVYFIYVIVKSFVVKKNLGKKFKNANYYDNEISDAEFREVNPDDDVKEN